MVLYDGQAGADGNWFESTGIARSTGGTPTLTADPGGSYDLTTSLSPAPGVGPSPPSEEDTHAQGPAAH